MASSIYNKVANITFNVRGFAEITKYQKYLLDSKEKEVKAQEQILATWQGTRAEYVKQEKKLQRLQKEFTAIEKEALKFADDINAVRNTINDLENASPKAINKLNAVFARMSKNSSAWSDDAKKKFQALVGAVQPVTQAMAEQFKKGFTNMMKFDVKNASWSQLNNYILQFNKNGRELAQVAQNEASAFAKMGQKATECKIEMGKLDGSLLDLKKNADPNAIQRYMDSWKKIAEFNGASARQISDANQKIASARAQLAKYDMKVVSKPGNFAPKEVEESTQRLKEYLSTTRLSKAEQDKLAAAIKNGTEASKRMVRESNLTFMTNQFKNLSKISNDALAGQKQYWTEMMNGVSRTSSQYKVYESNLQKVVALERQRANAQIANQGTDMLRKFQNGAIGNSANELQRAVDTLTKWRGLIDGDKSPHKFKLVSQAIDQLNQRLVMAQDNVKMAQSFMANMGNKNAGAFKGTIQDLERIKAGLLDMRKNVNGLSPKQIQAIDNALIKCENHIRTAGISSKQLNAAISNPKGEASLKVLEAAYAKLEAEIKRVGISQTEFNTTASKMKSIKQRIDSLNGSLGKQSNLLTNLGTNMKNIVLHYIGLNMIIMRIINTFKGVFELSDQMTNVQKVTQMTATEVTRLVDELQAIDSRTDTTKLMEFAEQAGKLGIYTKQGVEGMKQFVQMGERINATLGEDIGGAQAIADLVKVNDILGTTNEVMRRTGNSSTVLRDALNAIGSSILNVGNNSAAGYAAITNYVGRLGAIGSTSNMAVQEIIALGGALDALKMPAEAGSTALAQFMAAIQRRTDEMAYAAKVSVVELRELASKDMYGAVTLLLKQVRNGTVSAQGLMDAMSGRSRTNVNIRKVIQLLSGHMELLNEQLKYANQGFDSAFGSKTAGDVQLIMQALSDSGFKASYESMRVFFSYVKDGFSIDNVLEHLKKYNGDMGMLRSALQNVFTEMTRLDQQGKLNEKTFMGLATATNTMSIMEMEFARVNENAAGQSERLGNAIRERFVNSDAVEFFHSITNSILSFVNAVGRGETYARMFATMLVMLTTYTIAYKAQLQELIAVRLWDAIVSWVEGIRTFTIALNASIKSVGVMKVATNGLSIAWTKLKAAMAANWITLLVTAIAGLVMWIKSASDEAKRFAKATIEARQEMDQEIRTAAYLFAQLNNVNLAESERSNIISQINNKYGTLLGYMLKEKATVTQLANAYALVVSKIKEKAKAQLQDKMLEQAQADAAEEISNAGVKVQKSIEKITEDAAKQGEMQSDVTSKVSEQIARNPTMSAKDISRIVLTEMERKYSEITPGSRQSINLFKVIKELTEGMQKQAQNVQRVSSFIAGQNMADQNMSNSARNNVNREVADMLQKALKSVGNNITQLSNDELNKLISRIKPITSDQSYTQAAKGNPKLFKNIQSFFYWLENLTREQTRRTGLTPWGNPQGNGNMESWSTDLLTAYHKKLESAAQKAAQGVDVSSVFPDLADLLVGKTAEEMRSVLDEEDEKVKAILDQRHMTVSGTFHHPSETDREPKFNESDSALAELDRYYSLLDEQEKSRLEDGLITEEEYNRKKLANEMEHLERRNALRKYFDGQNREQFLAWWKSIEELDKIEWGKVNKEWAEANDKRKKENLRSAQKDMTSRKEMINKATKEIKDIINNDGTFDKLVTNFVEALDKIDIILRGRTPGTKEDLENELKKRVSFLIGQSENAYGLTLASLKKAMQDAGFNDWAKSLGLDVAGNKTNEFFQYLLDQLRKFRDEYDQTVRKLANQTVKIVQSKGKVENQNVTLANGKTVTMSQDEKQDYEERQLQDKKKIDEKANSIWQGKNFNGTTPANDKDIELYKLKIYYSKLYIAQLKEEFDAKIQASHDNGEGDKETELIKARGIALEDAYKSLNDLQSTLMEEETNRIAGTVEAMKPFQDAIDSFAYSFGEAVFGSKEDRQNAAKDLLKTVAKTTLDILKQKLILVTTKALYSKMELRNEQATASQITAAHASSASTNLSVKGAETTANIVMDEASSIANAFGQSFWVGLALSAAISAAFAGLMGLLNGALNKGKNQIQASAGKLTTGMLTYAKGRYPVYASGYQPDGSRYTVTGSDGRNYNAVVKPNLTTGEYNTPHLGIVGEKGAELIVDHPTFTKLKTDAPWILKGIYDMKRFGTTSLNHTAVNKAMATMSASQYPTHAQGNYPSIASMTAPVSDASASASTTDPQLQATLDSLNSLLTQLNEQGVRGTWDVYGDQGLVSTYDKAKKLLTTMGR